MHHSNKYVYDCRMQNILINTCQDESYQRDQSHQMNTVSYWVYMRQLLSDQHTNFVRIWGYLVYDILKYYHHIFPSTIFHFVGPMKQSHVACQGLQFGLS